MSSNGRPSGANTTGAGEPNIRYPLDMDELDSAGSEFSWGEGLEPEAVRGNPPSEGGRYRGASPDCNPVIGVRRQ
jgi:hypothetical protein